MLPITNYFGDVKCDSRSLEVEKDRHEYNALLPYKNFLYRLIVMHTFYLFAVLQMYRTRASIE